jgi:mono/diheme cytochrome c family protein
MTNKIEDGVYNIPTKNGIATLAMHVINGEGRSVGHYKNEGWSNAPMKSHSFTPLNDAQIAALISYGLADDQRVINN